MIKAVLFDAGGVLHASNRAQHEDIKQELGLTDEQLGGWARNHCSVLHFYYFADKNKKAKSKTV